MEHPLISNVTDLTLEELQAKISELQRKYYWAQRHNAYLAHQISMALETYNNQYQERQRAIWEAASKNGSDYSDRINIS